MEADWLAAGNSASSLDVADLDTVFEQFDQLAPHIDKWCGFAPEALQLLASKEVWWPARPPQKYPIA